MGAGRAETILREGNRIDLETQVRYSLVGTPVPIEEARPPGTQIEPGGLPSQGPPDPRDMDTIRQRMVRLQRAIERLMRSGRVDELRARLDRDLEELER